MKVILRACQVSLLLSTIILVLIGCYSSQESVEPLDLIVYSCGNFEEVNLCKINIDGTGFEQITHRELSERPPIDDLEVISTGAISPVMNRNGEIVLQCFDAVSPYGPDHEAYDPDASEQVQMRLTLILMEVSISICSTNSEGERFDSSHHPMKFQTTLRYAINDEGEVWYSCWGNQFCNKEFDDGSFSFVREINLVYPFDISINNHGTFVFACNFERIEGAVDIMQLCISEKSDRERPRGIGSLFGDKQLEETKLETQDSYNHTPIINNRNRILYLCENQGDAGVCLIDKDGSEYLRRTRHTLEDHWAMNDQGQIVFSCYDEEGEDFEICVADDQFKEVIQLTENDTDDKYPEINNAGTIAYLCDYDLCTINFDGTGQNTLSVGDVIKPVTVSTASYKFLFERQSPRMLSIQ